MPKKTNTKRSSASSPQILPSNLKFLNFFLRYPKITAFICGGLSVLAFAPHYYFPILFITFSLLVILINNAKRPLHAFQIGYAFGFSLFSFGLAWIGNALLVDIAKFGWLYPLAFLACGAFFGLFVAFPAGLSYFFKNILSRYLAFASLWTIFEWLRSFFLTGFPWNLEGYTLAFSNRLIQFASVAGSFSLSLIVVLICALPSLLSVKRTKKMILTCLLIPLGTLFALYTYGSIRLYYQDTTPSETTIRLVQPSIPQSMKWQKETLEYNFNQYIRISQSRNLENIDFVIWGETASPYPLDYDYEHLQNIREAIPENGYLITGLVRYKFDLYQNYYPLNALFVINSNGDILASYDKSHLVPFGEYIPLRQYLPKQIRPITNAIGNFLAGKGPQKIQIPGQPSFGGLICYEVIFPHQILNQQERPQWIVNLTNDGWYGNSSGPYQHLDSTRMRAVEEGITIARAANTGISALISPYGVILGQIKLNETGILDINLPQVSEFRTPYSILGNVPVLGICLLLLSLSAYLALYGKKKAKIIN